jgi:hypothetical protein
MPRSEPSFWDDLRTSAGAWGRFPWLPAASVALTLTGTLSNGPAWPAGLLSLIFYAGWVGTERISYLRAFRSRPLTRSELWRLTRAFAPRYAVLSCLIAPLILPAIIALAATTPARGPADTGGFLLYANAVGLLISIAFTFVTSALAFTTRRVRDASRIGLRMIRTEWPACSGYVVVPPIVSFAIVRFVGPWSDADLLSRLLIVAGAPLLNLWFKGATVAFYLRRQEPGDDGAAFAGRTPPPPPPPPPRGDMQG